MSGPGYPSACSPAPCQGCTVVKYSPFLVCMCPCVLGLAQHTQQAPMCTWVVDLALGALVCYPLPPARPSVFSAVFSSLSDFRLSVLPHASLGKAIPWVAFGLRATSSVLVPLVSCNTELQGHGQGRSGLGAHRVTGQSTQQVRAAHGVRAKPKWAKVSLTESPP